MSKQKSYVITDAADQMAAEMAEANGLGKSAIVEILIRQAHAAKWSVAPVEQAAEVAGAAPEENPVYLSELQMSTRLRSALANSVTGHKNGEWVNANFQTLKDVADFGIGMLMKQRNFGKAALDEVKKICEHHGLRIKL
jgi:hypothetical protein